MLSISNPLKGAGCSNYFLQKARDHYYLDTQEAPGIWHGVGAKTLGLSGVVEKQAFERILCGVHPENRFPLVQNAGKPDRQTAWDFTLSAPKCVTILWAFGDEKTRRTVEGAQLSAVLSVLSYTERELGISRKGKGGENFVRAALTWAVFGHGASRTDDPQLHTHCILVNVGVREDGTTGTLVTKELFRHKIALGALYQAELAAGLRRELGVTIQPAKVGFHIEGIPHEVCRAFSTRRAEIEKLLIEREAAGGEAAKLAAIDSRPNKKESMREELFVRWREKAAALGWGPQSVEALLQRKTLNPKLAEQALSENLLAAQKRVPKQHKDLLRDAARIGLRTGAGAESILREVERVKGRGLFSIERKRLFQNAPAWNPASKITVPFLSLNLKKAKKWGKTHRELQIPGALVQLRQKKLFPKAPTWNPASKLELPAVKIWNGKLGRKMLKARKAWKAPAYGPDEQKNCLAGRKNEEFRVRHQM